MKYYNPPNTRWWSGRQADDLLYYHQWVKPLMYAPEYKIAPQGFTLMGYASDWGVQRNQGRTGARFGPLAFRKALGKLPIHLDPNRSCYDLGDVGGHCPPEYLQPTFCELLHWSYSQKAFPIAIGGGHDIVYPHATALQGFLTKNAPEKQLGIINLDAHFDLRDPQAKLHSGNSFSKLTSQKNRLKTLHLGIRKEANDRLQFQYAEEHSLSFIPAESCAKPKKHGIYTELQKWLSEVDAVYLTIDMDGFDAAHAPGVSAPGPRGFSLAFVFKIIDLLANSGKWYSMDIAEFNPLYDPAAKTANLVALLVDRTIHRMDEYLT